MTWIIVFLYSWIIFFIFVDKKMLRTSIYGGLIALAAGVLVDMTAHYFRLYSFKDQIIDERGAFFFHAAGPLFTMGVLFLQYYSPDKRIQAANIAVFSLSYMAVETLIIKSGGAFYIHWHFLASLAVNILFFTALSFVRSRYLSGKRRSVR